MSIFTIIDFAVFVTGAAIMIVEVLGLNIIAPYFGTSLMVTSNLIGVIFVSLSYGYFYGCKQSARAPGKATLGKIIFQSAVAVACLFAFREVIGGILRGGVPMVSISSLLGIVILFALPSALFGMVLPYAVALEARNIKFAGRKIGRLYAWSVAGSIVGTFLAAAIIVPRMGVTMALAVLVVALGVTAYLLSPVKKWMLATIPVLVIVLIFGSKLSFEKVFVGNVVSFDGNVRVDRNSLVKLDDVSSPYSRIQIFEGTELNTQKTIRFMKINRETHAGTFLDSNELVFEYAQFNRLGGHFNPKAKKALLLGGGGYSYANYFLGDTPLYDKERVWGFLGKRYDNNETVSLPVIASSNRAIRNAKPKKIFVADHYSSKRARIEGLKNHIESDNQVPGKKVIARSADIEDTEFPANEGFVHVHEIGKGGAPGKVISPDIYLKPHTIIGHSDLISGANKNVSIPLDRPTRENEVVYVMLHRDNGNKRYDPILVDGYEKIERLDVVEIDPQTTKFAKKYFHLNSNDPRLRIFHEDARTYLNRSKNKYDIVYFDAFRSFYGAPFQLTTIEAVKKTYDLLNPGGVVVVNMPSALSGKYGKFFQAEYKTYQQIFPFLKVYAVFDPKNETRVQNVVMIAFRDADKVRATPNDDDAINKQLNHEWHGSIDPDTPILTDDFAPIDYFVNAFANISTF